MCKDKSLEGGLVFTYVLPMTTKMARANRIHDSMASDCASLMPMMESEVVCWCPDLAGHTCYFGEVERNLLEHLESRLTAKSLPRVHGIPEDYIFGEWS